MKKKITALFFVIILLSALLYSSFELAFLSGHECMGENCLICMRMECIKNILSFALLAAFISPVPFIIKGKDKRIFAFLSSDEKCVSLVNMKVKLSD